MNETIASWQHRIALGLCLLSGLALVGGALAIWTYRSVRQQQAVAALLASPDYFGNSSGPYLLPLSRSAVQYDYEFADDGTILSSNEPPGPAWLRSRVGIDFFDTVRGTRLDPTEGDALEMLAAFPDLRQVELRGSGNDQRLDLQPLLDLPGLETLRLSGFRLVGDRLAVFRRLGRLRVLDIQFCRGFGDIELDEVCRLDRLEQLALIDCGDLTSAGLAKLDRLKNLRSLTFQYGSGFERIDDLKFLADLTSLEELRIHGVSDAAFAAVPPSLTVKQLMLANDKGLGENGLRNLAKFENLESLSLSFAPEANDAALAHVARLRRLCNLNVHVLQSTLTDECLDYLADLKQLKYLYIAVSQPGQFSSAAIDKLGKLLPACRIDYREPSTAP